MILNKKRVVCECGITYTSNTALSHINSPKCAASLAYKTSVCAYSELSRTHRLAWDIRLGTEAKSFCWVGPVLNGQIDFKHLVFKSPRPWGVCTPSTISKFSKDRRGNSNPMSRINIYEEAFIKAKVLDVYRQYVATPDGWNMSIAKHIAEKLDSQYPLWQLGLIILDSAGRPKGKLPKIIAILRENCKDFTSNFIKIRGRLISKGQKASPECIRKARDSAVKNGTRRTTKPQIRLHKLIEKYDPAASLEFPLANKLFDIFSPKFNLLAEMHGRIWHDLTACPVGLLKMVSSNTLNDMVKISIAIENKYNMLTFWDDQEDQWESQLLTWIKNEKT